MIFIPHLQEPYKGTRKQREAYLAQQRAGLEYVKAYRKTIGWLAVFSIKKYKAIKAKEREYLKAREHYWSLV